MNRDQVVLIYGIILSIQMFWAGGYWNENWSRGLDWKRKIVVIAVTTLIAFSGVLCIVAVLPFGILIFIWHRLNNIFGIGFIVKYIIFKKKFDWLPEQQEFHAKFKERIKGKTYKWYQFKEKIEAYVIRWIDKNNNK